MAEKRYRNGNARPLEGLPVAVKEEAPIAGQRCTQGSLPLRHEVADETAVVVQRIIDAGGIVHARTTTPEFCCAPVTWTKLWGCPVTRGTWPTRGGDLRPARHAPGHPRRADLPDAPGPRAG